MTLSLLTIDHIHTAAILLFAHTQGGNGVEIANIGVS